MAGKRKGIQDPVSSVLLMLFMTEISVYAHEGLIAGSLLRAVQACIGDRRAPPNLERVPNFVPRWCPGRESNQRTPS